MLRTQKMNYLTGILVAIIETVKDMGDEGAPGGTLYAGLMSYGITLEIFNEIMGVLVEGGKLRKSGEVYFYVGD